MITPISPLFVKNIVRRAIRRFPLPLLLCCLACLVLSGTCGAQQSFVLKAEMQADSTLSGHIMEWARYNMIRLHVWNPGDSAVAFRVESSVMNEGSMLAAQAGMRSPLIVLPAHGDSILSTSQLFSLSRMKFQYEKTRRRNTGVLPTGDMSVCVLLQDSSGLRVLAQAGCVKRHVIEYRPQFPQFPPHRDTVPPSTISFRWKAVEPAPRHCEYHLKVFDRGLESYAAQVVRTRKALLDTILINQNSCAWKTPASSTVQHIVWQVQASDGQGNPYGTMDGYSDIAEFSVSAPEGATQQQQNINTSSDRSKHHTMKKRKR